ncbi:MAG: helix-turn-helix domain-containing protein [Lachnospiraceae bacterium]
MKHSISIGTKIKALRTEKKYTLKELSEKSGLSIGFLSQLEHGKSTIAIDSLAKLAEILDADLSSFFTSVPAPGKDQPVCRSFELQCSQVSPQIVQYILSNNVGEFTCLPRIFHLMPFAYSDLGEFELYQHKGEEFVYVMEGVLEVYLNGQHYLLNPGDSVQIHSEQPHNWVNPTNCITKILTINSPNPFRTNNEVKLIF